MSKMFSKEHIESDHTIKRFLNIKSGLKESSITGYIFVIKEFCNFTGMTPSEIHDIHRQEIVDRVPEFDMWLTEALEGYVSYLIDKGAFKSSIKFHLVNIYGFFRAFRLKPLPEIDISIDYLKEDAKHALDVNDIRTAIRNSTPTYQTLFIVQAQTGLAVGDALLLDVKDFINAVSKKREELTLKEALYRVKNENIIGCIDLRRKKSTTEFYTFIGPEALRSIASLLELRDEDFLKLETPIFLKDVRKIRSESYLKNDIRLSVKAVMHYVFDMHTKKGIFKRIKVNGKERNFFRTHKLRKWYANRLRFDAKFVTDDVKYLMGQKTGDVIEHYFDPNNYKALKENYRLALPYLAINDKIIMENPEKKEQLEKEKEIIKKIYKEDSKAKDEEIKSLKRDSKAKDKELKLIKNMLEELIIEINEMKNSAN